eukprot:COSAG02_NODE_1745_length_11097_cov_12.346518_12_plen_164_part_00
MHSPWQAVAGDAQASPCFAPWRRAGQMNAACRRAPWLSLKTGMRGSRSASPDASAGVRWCSSHVDVFLVAWRSVTSGPRSAPLPDATADPVASSTAAAVACCRSPPWPWVSPGAGDLNVASQDARFGCFRLLLLLLAIRPAHARGAARLDASHRARDRPTATS